MTAVTADAALPRVEDAVLGRVAGAVAALLIVAYQGWLLPFFLPVLGDHGATAFVLYPLYAVAIGASLWAFVADPDVRQRTWPLLLATLLMLAPLALHGLGPVGRAYGVTLVLGLATAILAVASSPRAAARLGAAATALLAATCLLDVLFETGFTNTAGRAAGLAINSNDAGAALVLGAVATCRSLPARWRGSFLVLIAGSVAATQSRSMIVIALLAALAMLIVALRERRIAPASTEPRAGRSAAVTTGLALIALLAAGLAVNDSFRGAALHNFAPASPAGKPPAEKLPAAAPETTAAPHPRAPSDVTGPAPAPVPETTTGPSPDTTLEPPAVAASPAPTETPPSVARTLPEATEPPVDSELAAALAAINKRLMTEGQRSSLSARWLFLERGLLVYSTTPPTGIGLEEAHRLAPHNAFVLFGLAFGHVGWLIPLVLLAALIVAGGWRAGPLAIATLAIMLTSHSLLLMPALFVPLALGMAGFVGGTLPPGAAAVRRAMAATALGAAVVFAVACVAAVLLPDRGAVITLEPQYIRPLAAAYQAPLLAPAMPGVLRVAGAADAYALTGDGTGFERVDRGPVAPGQFAIRNDAWLTFLPADGSDPVWNGVTYRLGVPLSVGPLLIPLVVLVLAWGAIVAVVLGRPRRSDGVAAG
jgi:hypothetical protein